MQYSNYTTRTFPNAARVILGSSYDRITTVIKGAAENFICVALKGPKKLLDPHAHAVADDELITCFIERQSDHCAPRLTIGRLC